MTTTPIKVGVTNPCESQETTSEPLTQETTSRDPVDSNPDEFQDITNVPMTQDTNPREPGGTNPDDLQNPASVPCAENLRLISQIMQTIIGSGILVTSSFVLKRIGSVLYSLGIWFVCGLVSMLGAFAYDELDSMIRSPIDENSYFKVAFGHFFGFVYSWMSIFVIKPTQLAITCLTFSAYLAKVVPEEYYLVKVIFVEHSPSAGIIVAVLVTLAYRIRLGSTAHNAFNFLRLLVGLIIFVCGFHALMTNDFKGIIPDTDVQPKLIGSFVTAFSSGLWAYDGWNNLNYLKEENSNPRKSCKFLYAIIAFLLVTFFYLFVNISYLTVMSPSEITTSEIIAKTFITRTCGIENPAHLLVLISIFASATREIFSDARLYHVACKGGNLQDVLSSEHKDKPIPHLGLILNAFLTTLIILFADIELSMDIFIFTSWFFHGMFMIALLILIIEEPSLKWSMKVKKCIIPSIVLIISLLIIIVSFVVSSKSRFVYPISFGIIIISVNGLIVYLRN